MNKPPQIASASCRRRTLRRRGALIYLVAVLIVLLMAAVAFSVDVAYMQLVRTQLRTANDLAARAGAEALDRTGDTVTARTAVKNIALANKVAGVGLTVTDSQITFGKTTTTNGVTTFTANATPYNSVRVQATRTGTGTNGAINLFFGGLFGRGNFSPQTAATVTTTAPKKRDIALVVDRSGSMEDSVSWGSNTSKWDDLCDAVDYFFDSVIATADDTEMVGLASYDTKATLDMPLTTSYSKVLKKLDKLEPGDWTNISGGMEKGQIILQNHRSGDDVEKVMLVMTDGIWNRGYDPVIAAQAAAADGIRVITITFGTNCDIPAMEATATAGGGVHYHAPSREELIRIFSQLGSGEDGLQYAE